MALEEPVVELFRVGAMALGLGRRQRGGRDRGPDADRGRRVRRAAGRRRRGPGPAARADRRRRRRAPSCGVPRRCSSPAGRRARSAASRSSRQGTSARAATASSTEAERSGRTIRHRGSTGFRPPTWPMAVAGRIGMTVLPGKRGPSVRYPGRVYRGDRRRDLGGPARARRRPARAPRRRRRAGAGGATPSIVERAAAPGCRASSASRCADGDAPRDTVSHGRDPRLDGRRPRPTVTWRWPAWAASAAAGPSSPARSSPPAGTPTPRSARVRRLRHPTAVETRGPGGVRTNSTIATQRHSIARVAP